MVFLIFVSSSSAQLSSAQLSDFILTFKYHYVYRLNIYHNFIFCIICVYFINTYYKYLVNKFISRRLLCLTF